MVFNNETDHKIKYNLFVNLTRKLFILNRKFQVHYYLLISAVNYRFYLFTRMRAYTQTYLNMVFYCFFGF